jgi:site-specific DNA-methyltransferase (adenine-specific)
MTIDVGTVAKVSISSIICEERIRQDLGDLDGQETSMRKVGMAQPLAVMDLGNGQYKLLAGGRRLAILQRTGTPNVTIRIYPPNLSLLEQKAVELAENFWRKDMLFNEYDQLIKEIHELETEIHGKRISPVPDAPGWTQEKTADLMGITRPAVTTALKRAAAREALPDVFAGCKTQADANKVLDKLAEGIIKEALAKKIEQSMPSSSTLQRLSQSYILKDFFEGVSAIPNNSVHLVEIDPPYGIDLQSLKKQEGPTGTTDLGSYNEVDTTDYVVFMSKVLKESYRVMTDHSWLICWFAPEPWAEIIYQLITSAGFKTTRLTAFWPKGSGQSKNPTIRLANSDERFYYASKGSPALARPGHTNEFRHAPVPSQKKIHPTERPIELMKDIYSTFTWEGSRLLIPFLGSGSGLIAAHELKINAFGYELSSAYRDAFLLRVNSLYGCEL